MWLVVCFPTDASALWAAHGLARRGLAPLVTLSPEALVYSRDLVHTITNGRGRTTFTLPDGRPIDSAEVRGTLNRVTAVPVEHLAGAATLDDRYYAEHELHAVVLSVLLALGDRVLNRPTPHGLAGRVRLGPDWLWLAGRAGFQAASYSDGDGDGDLRGPQQWRGDGRGGADAADAAGPRLSSVPDGVTRQVLVLDDRVYGDAVPPNVAEQAIALARLAETRLLGVEAIETRRGEWWFGAASATPDLRAGGEPLLAALADALGHGAPGHNAGRTC